MLLPTDSSLWIVLLCVSSMKASSVEGKLNIDLLTRCQSTSLHEEASSESDYAKFLFSYEENRQGDSAHSWPEC